MLGFSGPAAFAAAFRAIVGATPADFFPEQKRFPAI